MNNKKEVNITITDFENCSYVEKHINCDTCHRNDQCADMEKCPLIEKISHDVLRTRYNIDKSVLHIDTGAYGHDFRRARNVVNAAIDACCRQR